MCPRPLIFNRLTCFMFFHICFYYSGFTRSLIIHSAPHTHAQENDNQLSGRVLVGVASLARQFVQGRPARHTPILFTVLHCVRHTSAVLGRGAQGVHVEADW